MRIFRTWTFRWWEMGLLKACLISLGIILALYVRDYLIGLMWFWWTVFIATTVYFLAKWVKEEKGQ